ncbi:MAG: porin [Elusimicrobiota bacterium]|nr:porin [Elusimicrobiota bacterium]
MRELKKILVVTILAVVGFSSSGYAVEDDIKEIKKQIEVLTEEIEKLKLGAVAEPKYESFMGLGPAASKVYGIDKGLSIGGYGELSYSNYHDSTKKDFGDAYRFILYGGYKFNDRILMNTELEFEHAGVGNAQSKEPEVYVEFSYLDFLLNKPFNLRAGLMLMPVGIINEFHEPTVYHGVLRPEIETNIIPSTWREMGIMAHGEPIENLTYKIALINGLRADKFSNSSWIRSGRQQGAKVNADVGALVATVNYEVVRGLSAGGSYYRGEGSTGKGGDTDAITDKEADVNLYEVHSEFRYKGLEIRGLYAAGKVDNENDAFKNDATLQKVGKEVGGWYLQTAYDVLPLLPLIKTGTEMGLSPFVRYERYDTNKKVSSGTTDATLDRTVTTFGFGFKPHPLVVIKADYQLKDTESDKTEGTASGQDSNKIDQYNIGVGFIF